MKEGLEVQISSASELDKVVEVLLDVAKGRKKIALSGDLGAGKTAFVKAFCRKMGVMETVTSPTFALVNEYAYLDANGQEQLVHHLDLYRLKTSDEALDIGIENYLYGPHYCFIEWPEILEGLLPADMLFVRIEALQDSSRCFSFSDELF